MNERDFARFASRLMIVGDHLLWTGGFGPGGYGHLSIGRKNIRAHRAAYEHWVGPIPEGMQIDHLCYIRNCCAPAHLECVTQEENLRRVRKHEADSRRALPKTARRRGEPRMSDVYCVLHYLNSVPGAATNQVVVNLAASSANLGNTKAKTAIKHAVNMGLVSVEKSGPSLTDAFRHTLTDEGVKLLSSLVGE